MDSRHFSIMSFGFSMENSSATLMKSLSEIEFHFELTLNACSAFSGVGVRS